MSVGHNTIYNIAGAVVPLVLALATIPLYLELIGTERYGVLAIAWMVLGYFGMFDLGLGPATAQRISVLHASTPEHRAGVFWTAAVVNLAVGSAGAVLLYIGMRYFFLYGFKADAELTSETLEALPYLALGVPVATLSGVARGALQGSDKFLELNVTNIIGTTLFLLLPLGMAYLSTPEIKWLVIAAVFARVLALILVFSRTHMHLLKGFRPAFDQSEWRMLLSFGGWVSITMMIGQMMVASDRLLIGSLLGASAVAVYSVAFDLSRRISLFPNALGGALFPRFAQLDFKANEALMMRSIGTLGLIMSAPVVAGVFLMGPFLDLWLGAELGQQASGAGKILLIAYWGNAFSVIPFVRIQAEGRPDIVTKATLMQAPLMVAALYYATDAAGLIGAALVVAARCILEALLMLFLANRKLTFPPFFIANIGIMAASYVFSNYFSVLSMTGFIMVAALSISSFACSWLMLPDGGQQEFKRIFLMFSK